MRPPALHLKRYREIAALLWKYGRSDLVKQLAAANGFGFEPPAAEPAEGAAAPDQLVDDLEAMGPTYVKLGQVFAGRPDLLPEAYLRALARLQDNVKPFPYAEVEQIVMTELGVRISKAFAHFDPEPLAAASLGQVHAATLRDGRAVVVKVQRPDIRRQIAEDFDVLVQIAGWLDAHTEVGRRNRFLDVLDEFRAAIRQELNYEREAQNLVTLGKNLAGFGLIHVPQPVSDFCTRSVLTMEEVRGSKVTAVSPLARLDHPGGPLAEELFKAYLQQVLVDGLFHADPHPGNVFLTDDGRIALIDLGMVGHTTPAMQESLFKLLLAVSEGNGDAAAEVALGTSHKLDGADAPEFRRRIAQLVARRRDQGLEELRAGRTILEVSRIARENGIVPPSELVLLGKTLLQLDEVGRVLDPAFDPNASIRRNVRDLMRRRIRKNLNQGGVYASLLEAKDFLSGLPVRINRVLDGAVNAELELRVRSTDARMFLDGLQKIANRITMGVVLAGLVIGAALLMRVPTRFQLFGYPGLAIVCFIGAAAGGFWLVISVFVQDYRTRRKFPR